jgi:sulfatase modifying factor 1
MLEHRRARGAPGIAIRLLAALALTVISLCAPAAEYMEVPGGTLVSVLAGDGGTIAIPSFAMRALPVSNAEYLAFIDHHPDWQRGKAPAAMADGSYLTSWRSATELGAEALPAAPVTNVSWFAAEAFCASEGGRLPTWYEWEYAAAADETRRDARSDPAWRARILAWYAHRAKAPAPVGGTPNVYGVRDLHGLIWEWVDDFNALLVSSDSRDQGDADKLRFCGAGAISMRDRENYAVLMRAALLSSLNAADTSSNLGFRCVRAAAEAPR